MAPTPASDAGQAEATTATADAGRAKAKTVLDKVLWSVGSLAEPAGASRVAIAKCVSATFGEVSAPLLKRALAAGVKAGKFAQTGQRFMLAGVHLAPRAGASVVKTVIKEGSGAAAGVGDKVDVRYVGTLASDGSEFDRAAHFQFTLGEGEVIKGWDAPGGILGMRAGERAQLEVPPSLGYGKRGAGREIPPDSTLLFDVTLNKVLS